MRKYMAMILGMGCLICASRVSAALITVNATSPANNASAENQWLAAAGIAQAQNQVDFENLAPGTHTEGNASLFTNMVINVSTGTAQVRGSSVHYFGDSGYPGPDPSKRALALIGPQTLTLDFSAKPVDYVSFFDININTFTGTAYFTSGSPVIFSFPGSGGLSGNTANFFGIFRNDMPQITKVTLVGCPHVSCDGSKPWGIDNICYGSVPEPATVTLFGLGMAAFMRKRRSASLKTA